MRRVIYVEKRVIGEGRVDRREDKGDIITIKGIKRVNCAKFA